MTAGKLYLVPTPIGNLGDMTLRGIEVLSGADFIAAEDTRVTLKLLNHLKLRKPLVSYHRHSPEAAGRTIVERLLAGEICALVTDAGTPGISDPGEDLVALCVEGGIEVESLPGACALTTALAVSGLSTVRFVFEGFLPTNRKNRRARLEALRQEERTMIFYEAPHKLSGTLEDFVCEFGADRRVSVCRELTKLHEDVQRITLGEARNWYKEHEPRGEFVLVVEGARQELREVSPEDGLERVSALRAEGESLKAACKLAGEELGISKNRLYALALERGL